jgi:hypothetical protein
MELNNILINSLDILVKSGIKHFVDINLQNATDDDVNNFFIKCETHLNETQNNGTVEWDGDNIITGRYTILGSIYMTENDQHCQTLLMNYNELMEWANSLNVESMDVDENEEEELFAVIYHAYILSRTDMLITIYHDIKAEFLNRGVRIN